MLSIVLDCSAQLGDYRVLVDVSGNGYAHNTQIYFDDESWDPQNPPTYSWDACCDALMLLGNEYQPHIFTQVVEPPSSPNNHRLSINGLPLLFEQTDVPLGFLPGTLAQYTFSFKDLYTLPNGVGVELEDLSLNVTQDLILDSTYVTWGAISDPEERFVIHFYPSNVTTVIEEQPDEVQIFNLLDGVLVNGLGETEDYLIQLFDTQGRLLQSEQVRQTNVYRIEKPNGTYGTFIVEVTSPKKGVKAKMVTFY